MKSMTLLLTATAIFVSSNSLSFAETSNKGVLALINTNDTAAYDSKLEHFETKVNTQGCNILREGPVLAEDGDIDLDQPNRFIYMACTSSLLGRPDGRALISELNQGIEYAVAVEGVSILHDDTSFKKTATARSYILKVSHYNNTAPTQRDQDLTTLGALVRPRSDTYKTEAFVGVSQAYGMPTPDEAVVIYYDSPDAGDRFRKNNPDILEKVVDFNDKHLNDFVYYVAQSRR
ncbi:hypothetical protein [uncultured Kiloniella sp.]|uniref:hypothetical protein n=1 Tax=uncultured Kiloniella sp. TaxID=1133091 RepID=UPI00260A32F3|nr:hypothetical protein [uncultured Kiloniella sp.]